MLDLQSVHNNYSFFAVLPGEILPGLFDDGTL